jgi:hypothetical protein
MLTYTDKHIKFYTEVWAVKRLNKGAYLIKETTTQSMMLLLASMPVMIRSGGLSPISICGDIVLTAGMGYLWARLSFWTAEKNYRKFLKYQASKHSIDSKSGEFYN